VERARTEDIIDDHPWISNTSCHVVFIPPSCEDLSKKIMTKADRELRVAGENNTAVLSDGFPRWACDILRDLLGWLIMMLLLLTLPTTHICRPVPARESA
jgi:hypothetical protein